MPKLSKFTEFKQIDSFFHRTVSDQDFDLGKAGHWSKKSSEIHVK